MTTLETHPNATPAASSGGGALPGLQPATRRALAAAWAAGGANAQRFADIGHAMRMAATSRGDTRASYLAMAVYLCTGVSPHRVTEEGARESVNAWVDQMTAAQAAREA